MAYRGKFKPRNPAKYVGDPTSIIYRSSWELRCMNYFDLTEDIIQWASEEVAIPYKSPIDGRIHRYYPDFILKVKTKSGKEETHMWEVKPYKQSIPPTVQTKKTKRYINEVRTYAINKYKWDAAQLYCKEQGWHFKIITEKELGI